MENQQTHKEIKRQTVEDVEACRVVCGRFRDIPAYDSQCLTSCLERMNMLTAAAFSTQHHNKSEPSVIRLPQSILYPKNL